MSLLGSVNQQRHSYLLQYSYDLKLIYILKFDNHNSLIICQTVLTECFPQMLYSWACSVDAFNTDDAAFVGTTVFGVSFNGASIS